MSNRISTIELGVDNYVNCWKNDRRVYDDGNIYEDNDFGCEGYQIFKNGFDIKTFTHNELSHLTWLLTRELRGQINHDHKILWSWCGSLVNHYAFKNQISLFEDYDWTNALVSLFNLLLTAERNPVAGPEMLKQRIEALTYVNRHLLNVNLNHHTPSAPLSFAVLEGLLRRKNKNYLDRNGKIIKNFQINDPVLSNPYYKNKRVNRINVSLRIFEQCTVKDRQRPCNGLSELKKEILNLYPNEKDAYNLIDSWRNDFIHGKAYWHNRTPIIANLICLLIIDEIDPSVYETRLGEIRKHLEWEEKNESYGIPKFRPEGLYPPDLDR